MDFKSLRSDKLKLTQEEFANLYGISIQEVQELDKTGKPGGVCGESSNSHERILLGAPGQSTQRKDMRLPET